MKNIIVLLTLMCFYACKKTDKIFSAHVDRNLYLDSLESISTNLPATHYSDLIFTDEKTGYAVASGLIVKSSDGGITWSQTVISMDILRKIQFTDSQTGYIIGNKDGQGYVLISKDAGNTWKPIKLGLKGIPNGIFFLSKDVGFITGQNSVLKTTDGGQTWMKIVLPIDDLNFYDINFKNSKEGIVTASKGIYLKTIDGGKSWEIDETPYSVPLGEIYFTGKQTLVTVSNDEMIDINNNFKVVKKPSHSYKQLYLSPNNCIGIGSHYDQGFWPYGDIFVTNNGWMDYKQKTFTIKEAISFGAIAKMSETKIMILGLGIPDSKVLLLNR